MEKLLQKTTRNGFNSLRNYGPKLWPYLSSKTNGNNNYLKFGAERCLTISSKCFSANCYGRILNRKIAERAQRNVFCAQKHVALLVAAANSFNFETGIQRSFHSNESWLKYKFDKRIFNHGTCQICEMKVPLHPLFAMLENMYVTPNIFGVEKRQEQ